jgi:anaerobic ribonucleoside-triphosphate reductase activating protein
MDGSLFADKKEVHDFCQQIDILIDGPYIKSLNDGLSLRGSSNQKIHLLSNRYSDVVDEYYNIDQRNVELHMLNNEIFLAGIPGKEMLMKWQDRFVRQ